MDFKCKAVKWFKEWIWGSVVTILFVAVVVSSIWFPIWVTLTLIGVAVSICWWKWERSSRPSLFPADKPALAKKRPARKTRVRKR